VNNNCLLATGQTAYCVKSVCTCQNGYQPNQDGTECIRIRRKFKNHMEKALDSLHKPSRSFRFYDLKVTVYLYYSVQNNSQKQQFLPIQNIHLFPYDNVIMWLYSISQLKGT